MGLTSKQIHRWYRPILLARQTMMMISINERSPQCVYTQFIINSIGLTAVALSSPSLSASFSSALLGNPWWNYSIFVFLFGIVVYYVSSITSLSVLRMNECLSDDSTRWVRSMPYTVNRMTLDLNRRGIEKNFQKNLKRKSEKREKKLVNHLMI